MKTRNNNAVNFRPISPCLRLFIRSLLAEDGAGSTIEECLDHDAIMGSNAFASSAPPADDKDYN